MKTAKRLLWLILLLPLILIALAVALIFTLDPNTLKPVLRDAAAGQGIDLDIQGDLSWQFWPNLGFGISALTLKETGSAEPLFSARNAALSVQLRPLFQRQIRVDGIQISAATINLQVDENGKTNWSNIGSDSTQPDDASTPDAPPELSISSIRISDAALSYQDKQANQTILVQKLNLEAEHLAFDGQPFPLTASMIARVDDLPALAVNFSGDPGLNLDAGMATLNQAEVRLRSHQTDAQQTGAAVANFRLSTQTRWGDALSSEGQINLDPLDARAWLALLGGEALVTRNPAALGKVGANLSYDYREDQLRVPDFDLQLDQTQIKGNLSVSLGETLTVQGDMKGTDLNLDDYLSPPAETTAPAPPPGEPTPLPMEALRSLALDLAVGFNQITVSELPVKQPQFKIIAKNGTWLLDKLSAGVAEGTITGNGQLDASTDTARMNLDLAAQNINLGQILREMADFSDLEGKVQARANLISSGKTDQALMDNLVAEATVNSAQMQWQKINLEQQFCKAMAFLHAGEAPAYNWSPFTDVKSVDMKLAYAQDTLQINHMNALLAKLGAKAEGMFNVATGQFDVPLSLSLGSFAGEIPGCLPISQKWRDRALPIRCKGTLDQFGPKTCLPDVKLLTDIAKGRLKDEANAKLQEKKAEINQKVEQKRDEVEKDLKDKSQQLLREKLGEEKSKATEDSVRNLLKKVKNKPDQPSPNP